MARVEYKDQVLQIIIVIVDIHPVCHMSRVITRATSGYCINCD